MCCLHQPLAIYEEPLIFQNDVHDRKLLLEGADMKIAVKNQQHEILHRISFFITANHDLAKWVNKVDGAALGERTFEYHFNTQIANKPDDESRYPQCPESLTPTDMCHFFILTVCTSNVSLNLVL